MFPAVVSSSIARTGVYAQSKHAQRIGANDRVNIMALKYCSNRPHYNRKAAFSEDEKVCVFEQIRVRTVPREMAPSYDISTRLQLAQCHLHSKAKLIYTGHPFPGRDSQVKRPGSSLSPLRMYYLGSCSHLRSCSGQNASIFSCQVPFRARN